MKFRDWIFALALERIERKLDKLLSEQDAETKAATDSLNKSADELNAAVAGNPVPK